MDITKQKNLMTRWLALADALSTVVDECRRNPTVEGTLGIRDDPTRKGVVAMMDTVMEELSRPTEPVYYVLYLLDDGNSSPDVQQAVKCKDYYTQCAIYNEVRVALDSTEMGIGMLTTPDSRNQFNGVTTLEIKPT